MPQTVPDDGVGSVTKSCTRSSCDTLYIKQSRSVCYPKVGPTSKPTVSKGLSTEGGQHVRDFASLVEVIARLTLLE